MGLVNRRAFFPFLTSVFCSFLPSFSQVVCSPNSTRRQNLMLVCCMKLRKRQHVVFTDFALFDCYEVVKFFNGNEHNIGMALCDSYGVILHSQGGGILFSF